MITGLIDGGPAYAAGLRNGQSLHHVSVYSDNPDRMATFTIGVDGGDKQIAFYPRGKMVAAWQYRLDQTRPCEQ